MSEISYIGLSSFDKFSRDMRSLCVTLERFAFEIADTVTHDFDGAVKVKETHSLMLECDFSTQICLIDCGYMVTHQMDIGDIIL